MAVLARAPRCALGRARGRCASSRACAVHAHVAARRRGCCATSARGSATARSHDRFIAAHRGRDRRRGARAPPSARCAPTIAARGAHGATLALRAHGGRRRPRCELALAAPTASCSSCAAEGAPLRLGARVGRRAPASASPASARATRIARRPRRARRPARRRPPLHRARLPARHARRSAASRRATTRRRRGCSPAAATRSGRDDGNGTRFELGAEPIVVSTRGGRRAAARCTCYTDPTPAARLRALPAADRAARAAARVGLRLLEEPRRLRAPGRRHEDFDGCRWHGIPLDAIVLDSPWETQYNTWEPNPAPVPGLRRDGRADARRGRAHGRLGHAVGEHRLARRPDPARPELASGCTARRRRTTPRAPSRALRPRRRRRAVRRRAGGWARLAGRLHVRRGRGVVARAGRGARCALGVEGIKADDGEGYYIPDDVRFADGTQRRRGGVGARRRCTGARCSARSTRSTARARASLFGR